MSELSRNFHTSAWQLSFPEKATICVFVGKEDTQKKNNNYLRFFTESLYRIIL